MTDEENEAMMAMNEIIISRRGTSKGNLNYFQSPIEALETKQQQICAIF